MTNKRDAIRANATASFTMRPYEGEGDLSDIAALLAACQIWEHAGHDTLGAFQHLLVHGNTRHSCLWRDGHGILHACAFLLGTHLSFYIHPLDQEGILSHRVMLWVLRQTRAIAYEQAQSLEFLTRVCANDAPRIALLEHYNFRLLPTSLAQMQRSLTEPLPEIHLSSDFTIRPLASEADVTSYLTVFKEVFGVAPSIETVYRQWREKEYHRHYLLIAHDREGRGVACGHSAVPTQENALLGRAEGWIEQMGTRPAFRQQGLGHALLVSQLQCLKDAGVQLAILETGYNNSTAQRLYTSLGFHHSSSRVLQYGIMPAAEIVARMSRDKG